MSKYRKKYVKKKKIELKSVVVTALSILLVVAALGGLAALFRDKNVFEKEENTIIYLIPSSTWNDDNSNIGAYVWLGDSNKFVLGSDENEDGIFEFTFDAKYTSVIFVDLKPDTNNVGLNWSNVREQSADLLVPEDDNVYYHQYVNQWSDTSETLYNVITEPVTVKLDSSGFWAALRTPVVYCFDKTGVKEPVFVEMTQVGNFLYQTQIPSGYTHVIFLEYGEEGEVGSWDNVLNQTEDLVIPIDTNNLYVVSDCAWIAAE